MKEQQYNNHARLHPLYHYIGTPLALLTFIGSVIYLINDRSWVSLLTVASSVLLLIVFVLVRTYSLKVQDRVIRLEENFRHFTLTGKPLPHTLSIRQIIALRFAGDDQFPALCSRASQENLNPDAIKKAILTWRADHMRI